MLAPNRVVSLLEMISFLSSQVFVGIGNLSQASDMLARAATDDEGNVTVSNHILRVIAQSANQIKLTASELNLDATAGSVRSVEQFLGEVRTKSSGQRYLTAHECHKLSWTINALLVNFYTQMQSRPVIVVDNKFSDYLTNKPIFGEQVANAFPDAIYDVEEAAKSFALTRYTASVFHLMRAAESAVGVLAVKIGAATHNKNGEFLPWGILTANVKSKIDEMPTGAEQDEWLKVHMFLHAANRAYRTKTAHPVQKYVEDEAREAFEATRTFMRAMAALV